MNCRPERPHRRSATTPLAGALVLLAGTPTAVLYAQPTPQTARVTDGFDALLADAETQPTPQAARVTDGFDALLAHLQTQDTGELIRILGVLGSRGDTRAFRPIIDLLLKSQPEEVESAALGALEKLNYDVAFLLGVLRDSEQPALAQSYAAHTLGRMQSKEAVPQLITALESPHAEVREHAIAALGKIGDMRAWKPLIIMANKDPLPTLRAKAQQTVEKLASTSRTGPDADTLNLRLKDPDPLNRQEAAKALSQHGNWWSVQPLIEALEDPDPEVRRYAARALGDLQDKRAVTPLVAFLPHTSGEARYTAIIALAVLNDSSCVPSLISYLKDPDPETRRYTSRALGELEAHAAGTALTEVLHDVVPQNRREAALALGLVKEPAALPLLAKMANDDTEENRLEAIRAMGAIGSPDAIPILEKLLKSKDTIVVVTTITAMKNIGAIEAAPILEKLAQKHSDAWVKEEALAAAVELRGATRLKEAEIPKETEQ